jgi:hypothetical protein
MVKVTMLMLLILLMLLVKVLEKILMMTNPPGEGEEFSKTMEQMLQT